MDQIRQNIQDNAIMKRKNKFRANDSLSKYKKKNQNSIKNLKFEQNLDHEDLPSQNSKPQLTEISNQYKEKMNTLKKYEKPDLSSFTRKNSFISSKYSLSRAYTPRRDFRSKKFYPNMNTKNNINTTFYKTTDNFLDLYDMDKKNKISKVRRYSLRKKFRNYTQNNYPRLHTEANINTERKNGYLMSGSNYIRDNTKIKELNTLNNIYQKQNNELKLKNKEMKYQINDLLNYQKKLKLSNQNLKNQNQELLMSLANVKQELDNIHTMSFNELESKNNEINELNEEINQMRNELAEKDSIINNFQNNQNQNYAQNDIDELNYSEKDNQINELQKQLNVLKNKYNNLFKEKQKNEQILKQQLNQENIKYQNLVNNFKKEQEKFKNNYISQNQNQKLSLNNLQSQYENNIKELQEKMSIMQQENEKVNNIVKAKDQQIINLIEEKDKLLDEINNVRNMLKLSVSNDSFNNNQRIEAEKRNNELAQLRILSQNNEQLKQEIINLRNHITQLENEKEKLINHINENNNEQNDQEIQEQIISLKNEKEELQNKLLNYLNSQTDNNNKINKTLQEKNELTKENAELKNDIKELENENHKNLLQLSKLSELKNELEMIKKENNTNFEELKLQQEENQKLYNIIRDKERENQLLKNQISKNANEEQRDFDEEQFNIDMNNELEEKNNIIDKLEKQINILKNRNEKVTMENSELKEKYQLIQSGKDEGFVNTLDNLKEELKDKDKQITKLIEENKNLRNINKDNNINNINNEEEKEIDLQNNRNENNPFRVTMNSQGLNDADKIRLYRERIKECEQINESDKIQIKTLKEDIKIFKEKIKNLETFGGQIKDMNEFIFLLNQVLINYKPKKKEQKDALNKIINVLNNFQGIK